MTGKRIGKMLQTRREAKGLTQEDLTKRAKVARSYLAKLEAGTELRTPLNAILGFSEVLAERMFGERKMKQILLNSSPTR